MKFREKKNKISLFNKLKFELFLANHIAFQECLEFF